MENKLPLIGKLSLLCKDEAGAASICFEEVDSRRIIQICQYDHLVIHNSDGTVLFDGKTDFDYNTGTTILNARHVGQLIPWPTSVGYQGFIFVHGIPNSIPIKTWMTAITQHDWKVELTPCPALLSDTEDKNTSCVSGILEPYFETGTEGIIWSVHDPRRQGYEGLNCLENGDKLTVFEKDGVTIRWQGQIRLEYKRRWEAYPMNPKCGQQEVMGRWVHGFQSNLDPEVWAQMFFDKLPCLLTCKVKK